MEDALQHTRKCRVTANEEKYAVASCNEGGDNPVSRNENKEEGKVPIVDLCTHLGMEAPRLSLRCRREQW